jgi:hypothetical protein
LASGMVRRPRRFPSARRPRQACSDTLHVHRPLERGENTHNLEEGPCPLAERLMELEVGAAAGYGEKSLQRLAQTNGYRDRDWGRAPAQSSCASPSSRKGSYFPSFWSRAEKALTGSDPGGPTCRASRPARLSWSGRWARAASPRANSAGCARRSTAR